MNRDLVHVAGFSEDSVSVERAEEVVAFISFANSGNQTPVFDLDAPESDRNPEVRAVDKERRGGR